MAQQIRVGIVAIPFLREYISLIHGSALGLF